MIGLNKTTKDLKIKYDGQTLEFKIKRLPLGIRDYLQSILLDGKEIDNSTSKITIKKYTNKGMPAEYYRETLMSGLLETNIENEKGEKINLYEPNVKKNFVEELINDYPMIAEQLVAEIWNLTELKKK